MELKLHDENGQYMRSVQGTKFSYKVGDKTYSLFVHRHHHRFVISETSLGYKIGEFTVFEANQHPSPLAAAKAIVAKIIEVNTVEKFCRVLDNLVLERKAGKKRG